LSVFKAAQFRPFDYAALILAIAVTVGAALFIYSDQNGTSHIVIHGAEESWVFPENAVETVTVTGPLGDTVVELAGGRARVVSSPCVNQTCVSSGSIHTAGQWVACLPNRVFVSVEGGGVELDAVVY
jgi:hypothetical protein